MTSPNEPGHPRVGEGPSSANGAPAGPPGESSDVPPWQRGAANRANTPRPAEQAPRPAAVAMPPAHSPGVDARLNRFIAGGSAAVRDTEVVPARSDRSDGVRVESYASELPDLSAQAPRAARPPAGPDVRPAAAQRMQLASRKQGPVRASMQIRRIDPWSTLKVSLVLSAALFFVWMIAVAFLYLVLGGMGVWSKLNSNVGDLLTSNSGTGGELVSSGTIFGGAALIGLVNIVLLTAMATAAAFIYNLTTDLVGGIEVTLADRD